MNSSALSVIVRYRAYPISFLARACEIAGQMEEALILLDDALQIANRTGERWFAAELNRHKGRLLLRQGQSEAAEELYRKALSIAEEQGAKLWELRAAVSLARLRRDQGRRAEARDLLAPVYGWFTEGFGTRDLKEAKVLRSSGHAGLVCVVSGSGHSNSAHLGSVHAAVTPLLMSVIVMAPLARARSPNPRNADQYIFLHVAPQKR